MRVQDEDEDMRTSFPWSASVPLSPPLSPSVPLGPPQSFGPPYGVYSVVPRDAQKPKPKNSKSTCSSCAPPRGTYSRGAPVPKAVLCSVELPPRVYLVSMSLDPFKKSDLLEGDANDIIIIFWDYDDDIT